MDNCNKNFFKTINASSAYILGLMAADGCISEKRNEIRFDNTDKSLIDIFYNILEIKTKISEKQKNIRCKTLYRISFNSKEMKEDLIQLGVIPKKSLILKWINVDSQYESHFIRGYLDGDGTILYNHGYKWKIQFLGTLDFMEGIKNSIQTHLKINDGNIYKNGNIYALIYSKLITIQKIITWMYKDSECLRLERKYEIGLKILERQVIPDKGQKGQLRHYHKLFEYQGERKTLKAWSLDPRCLVCYQTLRGRVNAGMPLEQAFKMLRDNRCHETDRYSIPVPFSYVGNKTKSIPTVSRPNTD